MTQCCVVIFRLDMASENDSPLPKKFILKLFLVNKLLFTLFQYEIKYLGSNIDPISGFLES